MNGQHETGERLVYASGSAPLAFEPLLIPLVQSAEEKLGRRISAFSVERLSPEGRADLSGHLALQLAAVSAPVLFEDFARFREARASGRDPSSTRILDIYVAEALGDSLDRLRRTYPAWARLTAGLTDRWIESSGELLERLEADRNAIEKTFGAGNALERVARVQPGLSDRHDGGRTVHRVLFSSGARVVYKPRDLGPEAAFFGLLSWLSGRQAVPDLRIPALLTRSGYGWMESLGPAECETEGQARDFYRRAGSLLAVAYVLGATDCHAGNLIAAGPHPVLVDLETILQHDLDPDEGSRLLLTGFLPFRKLGLDGKSYDVGALTGAVGLERDSAPWRFDSIDTDAMAMATQYRARRSTAHRPMRGGEPIHPGRYVEDVISGFSSAYRAFMRHRWRLAAPAGPLSAFRHLPVRHLPRPTLTYAECIYRSMAPELLRNEESRTSELERWLREDDARRHTSDPAAARALMRAEVGALAALDVPRLTAEADSRDLYAGANRVAREYFRDTGFRGLLQRLEELSEDRLAAASGLIRSALGFARFSELLPDS